MMRAHRTTPQAPRIALVVSLFLATALGLGLTLRDYGIPFLKRAFRTAGYSAWDRSALGLLGNRGWQFMRFMDAVVPEQSPVVIPEGAGPFSEQNILQFFLFPRSIPGCRCPDEANARRTPACTRCLQEADHFIPAIGVFPPVDAMEGAKRWVPFPGNTAWYHGVYTPLDYVPPSILLPRTQVQGFFAVAKVAAIDFTIYFLLFVLGASGAQVFLGPHRHFEIIALAIPLGMGGLTWAVFLISWAMGGTVDPSVYLLALMICLAVLLLVRRLSLRLSPIATSSTTSTLSHGPNRWHDAFTILAFLLLAGLSLLISVNRAYSSYDEIANWALKGYATSEFNSLYAGAEWGGHGLAYPQNLALLISLFRLTDGDALPGSKAVFSLLLISLCVAFYLQWRRNSVPLVVSRAATCLVLTVPIVFQHSTLGYANLPFAVYVVLGVLYAVEGLAENAPRSLALGGLFLGFAAWTRPEGIGFGLVLLAAVSAMALARPRPRANMFVGLLPFAAIALPWFVFGYPHLRQEEIGQSINAMMSSLQDGHLNAQSPSLLLAYSLSHLTRSSIWGVSLYFISLALLVGGVFNRRGIRYHSLGVALLAVLLLALPIGMFYVASYSKSNLGLFLDVSFDRAMFPGMLTLLWSSIPLALSTKRE
jgi:hypothetical protein